MGGITRPLKLGRGGCLGGTKDVADGGIALASVVGVLTGSCDDDGTTTLAPLGAVICTVGVGVAACSGVMVDDCLATDRR